jgi:hypothetical protein
MHRVCSFASGTEVHGDEDHRGEIVEEHSIGFE